MTEMCSTQIFQICQTIHWTKMVGAMNQALSPIWGVTSEGFEPFLIAKSVCPQYLFLDFFQMSYV